MQSKAGNGGNCVREGHRTASDLIVDVLKEVRTDIEQKLKKLNAGH